MARFLISMLMLAAHAVPAEAGVLDRIKERRAQRQAQRQGVVGKAYTAPPVVPVAPVVPAGVPLMLSPACANGRCPAAR